MSEEILRIKIKDTEYAGIEVVPTESGVEIVVTRRRKAASKEPDDYDEPKGEPMLNIDKLRVFCTGKKKFHKDDKAILADLRRFWDFYSPRMPGWKGAVDCDKLWLRWCSTRQGSSVEYDD